MRRKNRLGRDRTLGVKTRERPSVTATPTVERQIGLTILCHPDASRVGERASLEPLAESGSVELSRASPDFFPVGGDEGFPLADAFLSRRPARLDGLSDGAVAFERAPESSMLLCDGEPLDGRRVFSKNAIERGVLLELGGRVVLLLHLLARDSDLGDDFGLIGESEAIRDLRRAIAGVREISAPILLRGETGSGKELVAQAIHRLSDRREGPCLSVNMAALAPSVASSELFGHTKGAFTGAVADHPGFFLRADGGTLFLDEIGEAPTEVQVMLLRALETGRIQPVGARSDQQVDVRLIAATDANLEDAVRKGTFRAALLHRLGYQIHVPPLRERVDDFGRLFFHFLREDLASGGEEQRLDPTDDVEEPYVPADLIARLARHSWPGNVRQLRNVVRQIVAASADSPALRLNRSVERLLLAPDTAHGRAASRPEVPAGKRTAQTPAVEEAAVRRRRPADVTEDELVEALRSNRWRPEQAANALGISRPSLYMLIDKSTRLRKAKDIPEEEIARCYRELNGDIEAMAERLEVSTRGLHLRMKAILDRGSV